MPSSANEYARLTGYLVFWLVAANLFAFALMILDKKFAESDARRIPERTMLGWALLGGASGMFLASRLVRHKTRKQPFAATMIAILILKLILLMLWLSGCLDRIAAKI